MRVSVAVARRLFVTRLELAVEIQSSSTRRHVNLASEAVEVRAAVVSVSVDAVIFTGYSR